MKITSSVIAEHQSAGMQSIGGLEYDAMSMMAPGGCTTCAASCCCTSCTAAVNVDLKP